MNTSKGGRVVPCAAAVAYEEKRGGGDGDGKVRAATPLDSAMQLQRAATRAQSAVMGA